ncbi:MAG: BatA domain-containing protein, partial [Planctomycetota bacterium]
MMLELAHPELLLLMVLLGLLWILLPLWRPRVARRRSVASTILWHRAIREPRSERPWMPLLLALALIVIASGPRVIPDENPSIALRRVIDGSIRIDIRVANASEGHLKTSEQEPRKFLLSDRGEAVIEMDDLAPGIPITVSVGTVNRKLIAPARNSTPIVSDLSGLREVADALAVLKKAHRIELS